MNNIQRIHKLSYMLQILCNLLILGLPLLMVYVWLNFEAFIPAISQTQHIPLQAEYIGPLNLILGFVFSLIPLAVGIYGLLKLRQLFALYRQSKFFSGENVLCLRAFAASLFANALLTPLTGALISVALTINNPPGERTLSISLGSPQLLMAFIAAIFFIIAWIMVEGRKLADENEQII